MLKSLDDAGKTVRARNNEHIMNQELDRDFVSEMREQFFKSTDKFFADHDWEKSLSTVWN